MPQKGGISPLWLIGGFAAAALVMGRRGGVSIPPVDFWDIRHKSVNARYSNGVLKRRGATDWRKITGITLHQVGVNNVGRKAYPKMTAHLAVHHDGTVYWIHPLNTLLWHGHGFNGDTVSIEVAGLFSKDKPLPPIQAAGVRTAIRFIKQHAAKNGARISFVYGHRQSSSGRGADPGRAIWQDTALWAEKNLGLRTIPDHTRGTGKTIPALWDPRVALDSGALDSGALDSGALDGEGLGEGDEHHDPENPGDYIAM